MKKIGTILLAAVLLLGTLTCLPFSVSAEPEGDFKYEVMDGEATIAGYSGDEGEMTIPSTLMDFSVTSTPEERNIPIGYIDWSLATTDGRTITKSTYANKVVLFVFYRASMSGGTGDCFNSNHLISELAASSWIGAEDVRVIAVDVDGNTAADVRTYQSTYAPDCRNIVFTYGYTGNLIWALRSAYGAPSSFSLAFCAVIKNDMLCYAWDGCASAMICQSALSQVSSVPDPDNHLDEELAQIIADGGYHQSAARSMLSQVNALRTGSDAWYWNPDNTAKVVLNNLGELTYDYALERIAMQRAAELAIFYSHTRPDGTNWFELAYQGVTSFGENIAYGFISVQSMFDGWAEESEPYSGQGHRRNMLDGWYNAIGIACFYYDGVFYWVQEFGYVNSGIDDPEPAISTPSGSLKSGLTWKIDDGVLHISGSGAMDDFGFGVAPWVVDAFTSANIESGVTSIGEDAFYGCDGLSSVEIPDSVTIIGSCAFYGCNGLTSIEIPKSVEEMGWGIFANCESLTDIYCSVPKKPDGWSPFWLYNCDAVAHWTICEHKNKTSYRELPTCGKSGYEDVVCDDCDEIISRTVLPATGEHSFSEWEVLREATCKVSGEAVRECTVCGLVEWRKTTGGPHNYVDGVCTECGKKDPNYIDPSEPEICKHNNTTWRHVDATCGAAGYENLVCNDCGEILYYIEFPATGAHFYGSWKETKAPTCTAEGSEERECSVCGYTETRAKAKISHTYVDGVCAECGAKDPAYIEPEDPDKPKPPTPILGDLGGDGEIDSTDYMLLKRFCLGSLDLTDEQKAVADVNKDGEIDSLDYMLVKRHVLGTYKIV